MDAIFQPIKKSDTMSFQTGPDEVWGHALALLIALKKKELFLHNYTFKHGIWIFYPKMG